MKLLEALHNHTANQRLNTCKACEHLQKEKMRCEFCGCFMRLKVMMPTAKCPKNKW